MDATAAVGGHDDQVGLDVFGDLGDRMAGLGVDVHVGLDGDAVLFEHGGALGHVGVGQLAGLFDEALVHLDGVRQVGRGDLDGVGDDAHEVHGGAEFLGEQARFCEFRLGEVRAVEGHDDVRNGREFGLEIDGLAFRGTHDEHGQVGLAQQAVGDAAEPGAREGSAAVGRHNHEVGRDVGGVLQQAVDDATRADPGVDLAVRFGGDPLADLLEVFLRPIPGGGFPFIIREAGDGLVYRGQVQISGTGAAEGERPRQGGLSELRSVERNENRAVHERGS